MLKDFIKQMEIPLRHHHSNEDDPIRVQDFLASFTRWAEIQKNVGDSSPRDEPFVHKKVCSQSLRCFDWHRSIDRERNYLLDRISAILAHQLCLS